MSIFDRILQYDTDLFIFLNNLGNESWDGFWWFITQNWAPLPLYLILLYLVFKHYGIRGTVIVVLSIIGMIFVTDQTASIFKHSVCRPRPCKVEEVVVQIREMIIICGRYGFFSAHAANSMAAAIFLGSSLRKWHPLIFWILIIWAVITGYSRIYLGVHYPSDVLIGMLFGGIIGWTFYKIQYFGQKKYNANHVYKPSQSEHRN